MKLKIIYEDKDIIVIDKPAGIAVHQATGSTNLTTQTIVSFVIQHYPPIKNIGENSLRPGIIHRLDKETSGLMVIAKNNETFFELKKQFRERKVEKKYIALVSGVLQKDAGSIEIPLTKIGPKTSSRFMIYNFPSKAGPPLTEKFKNKNKLPVTSYPLRVTNPKSKDAITEFKVLRHRYKDYTLVEVTPKTGRQHQIRVHFASTNHPVACDKLYGRKAKKCPPGLKRHFLHASHLKFQLKSALMEFDSALPEDLKEALKKINGQNSSL